MAQSPLYTTLQTTAREFALSTSPSSPSTNTFSSTRASLVRTPTCLTSFGPLSFAATLTPSTPLSNASFYAHMEGMIPHLQTWRVEVRDVVVDEVARKTVVRCWYDMVVKGEGEEGERTVRNDVTWFLEMEEGAGRVRLATEYVDAGASRRIGELIGKAREG